MTNPATVLITPASPARRFLLVFTALLALAGARARATDVVFDGEESWSADFGFITINSAEVVNDTYGGESGTLELVVWATANQYEGGDIYGYKLGTYRLGQLDGGYDFYNISATVPYSPPPDGVYFTTMTVEEWNGSQYVIDDWVDFGYEGFGIATPPSTYVITTTSSPAYGGYTTGTGVYDYDQDFQITATPYPGFRFVRWDYNGAFLSWAEDPSYYAKGNYHFVAVFAPLPEEVTLITNGIGKITHSFNAHDVLVGHNYTVTAVPGRGQIFAGWTGSYESPKKELTFTMELGTVLQANFEPDPSAISSEEGEDDDSDPSSD